MHRRYWGGSRRGHIPVLRRTQAAVAGVTLSILGLCATPLAIPAAGAATPSSPSVIQGTAWCGHFNHAASSSVSPGFQCPALASPLVTLVTDAPNGPFSSGQYIDVTVAQNGILDPGRHIYIRECEAPNGQPPTTPNLCDIRTTQFEKVKVGSHGTVSDQDYPIYALPDTTVLKEQWKQKPLCDLTHPCILFVGQDRRDFDRPHVWSLPFYVNPTAGDTGADPGNGLPETPYVLAFPVLAVGIIGGTMLVRRRRAAAPHRS